MSSEWLTKNYLNSEISQIPDHRLSQRISSVAPGGGGCAATVVGVEEALLGAAVAVVEAVVAEKQTQGVILRRDERSNLLKNVTDWQGTRQEGRARR